MNDLKHKSIDAIIWSLIEKYGIQVFSLVIGVILARLLTPADYGLIGMISVFFHVAIVFVNSGFGTAYIQKKDTNEIDASTIFYFNLFVSIIFYIILWFGAPFIAKFYGQGELIGLTRVSAIVLIINALAIMHISKLTKEVNFKKKSLISILSTIISGIIGITAALNNYGVWSLVFQQISRSIINSLGLWFFYKWRPNFVFSINSLKTMFSFSSWVLLTSLLRVLFENMYILVIGKFFPASQLGFYSKAKSYHKLVSVQPSSAVSIVAFPILSKLQNNKLALKNSMRKFMTYTLFLIVPISIMLIVIAKPLTVLILTEKWTPMVPYFQLLLIIGILFPINSMNVQFLIAQGKTNLNFKLSILKNILRIIILMITYRYGVIYMIYGELFASFISLFINTFYTKKIINYGIIEQFKDFSKIFISSILIFVIGYFTVINMKNDLSIIIMGIFSTITSYLIFHYIFNKDFLLESIQMLKSIIIRK